RDWSSDVCSSDLGATLDAVRGSLVQRATKSLEKTIPVIATEKMKPTRRRVPERYSSTSSEVLPLETRPDMRGYIALKAGERITYSPLAISDASMYRPKSSN